MQEALYSTWEEADAERDAEAAAAAAALAVAFEEDEQHGFDIDDAGEDLPMLTWPEAMELLRPHLKDEFKDKLFECGTHVLCAWSPTGCANLRRRMGNAAWDPVAHTFQLPHNPLEKRGQLHGKAKCKGYQKGFQGLFAHANAERGGEMNEDEEEAFFQANGVEPDQDCARLHRLLAEVLESIAVNPVTGQ